MKTLLSLLVTVVYLASVFGTIVMHIWAVAGMWESTKGLVGFLLFIFSMFTLFITELFILYQHVSYSGWFGSPYSIAATIHLLGLAVVMLIAQCSLWMKKEDQQEANKLGLSENEFEDFMKIGNMSPSEMFAENKEGKENFLQVTSEMIKSEEEKISNLAINCYRVKIPWSIAFKEVDASYEDDNAGFMFERLRDEKTKELAQTAQWVCAENIGDDDYDEEDVAYREVLTFRTLQVINRCKDEVRDFEVNLNLSLMEAQLESIKETPRYFNIQEGIDLMSKTLEELESFIYSEYGKNAEL